MQKKAGICKSRNKWTDMIIELQGLSQAGLTYVRDDFDLERYARIRNIAAEMMSGVTDISKEKVRDLFCGDSGYQTPKIDTRAATVPMPSSNASEHKAQTTRFSASFVPADSSVASACRMAP